MLIIASNYFLLALMMLLDDWPQFFVMLFYVGQHYLHGFEQRDRSREHLGER